MWFKSCPFKVGLAPSYTRGNAESSPACQQWRPAKFHYSLILSLFRFRWYILILWSSHLLNTLEKICHRPWQSSQYCFHSRWGHCERYKSHEYLRLDGTKMLIQLSILSAPAIANWAPICLAFCHLVGYNILDAFEALSGRSDTMTALEAGLRMWELHVVSLKPLRSWTSEALITNHW